MNEKTKFFLITLIIPLLLIILSVFWGGLLLMIIAVTWIGVSLLIFHPLEEE